MKSKKAGVVAIAVSAVILAFVIALTVAVGVLHDMIDKWVVGYKDGESNEAARAAGAELLNQIHEEGTVLVRNEKNEGEDKPVLPLSKEEVTQVNVFGWASVDWVYSGSGSGKIVNRESELISFLEALDGYGIEYNAELTDFYKSFQSRRNKADPYDQGNVTGTLHSYNYEFSRLYEPKMSEYSDDLLAHANDYSDTAFVVIGRVSGESNDSPDVQYKKTTKSTSSSNIDTTDTERTYLEISTEEEALLEYVGENFENVVVIINSTNVMELGFLEDIKGLDACLLAMTTGTSGAKALPSILWGQKEVEVETAKDADGEEDAEPETKTVKVSPSGKTADTWAYDLTTNPTYATVGKGIKGPNGGKDTTNFYTNSKTAKIDGKPLYPTNVQYTNASPAYDYTGVAYTDYLEGIYVGYRWYETADAEGFWDDANVKDFFGIENGYEDVVQYPFGFGLSYTEFEWDVIKMYVNGNDTAPVGVVTVKPGDEILLNVQVKNLTDFPGKDVVELYYTPPYEKGGVEKSAVNLLAFAKTQTTLETKDSVEVLPLSFKVSDMKSYDVEEGAYTMGGDYTITFRTDAHTVATDTMKTASSASFTLRVADTVIDEDPETNLPIENRFTGTDTTDGVAIDGNSDGTATINYMTRKDFVETFPYAQPENREMAPEIVALNRYTPAMSQAAIDPNDTPITNGSREGNYIVFDSASNKLTKTGTAIGQFENYDNDDLWDPILNAMSLTEMTDLVLHGFTQTKAVSSIGKPATRDLDGPNQIGSFVGYEGPHTGFSSIVLAQSWNVENAYSMGMTVGADCASMSTQGWYGPGINVHRSPFGGRNYEYYSEDPILSGMMSAYAIAAAKNAGVFSYLKHLCLYESESGRDGMYNWLTEQALREVYAKPFELSVKLYEQKNTEGKVVRTVGGSTAIMSSYGRIGAVWTGGSKALLTELVRGEWGFKGAIITDYADNHEFMFGHQMVRAGGDLWMDGATNNGSFGTSVTLKNNNGTLSGYDNSSATFRQALRRASKNIIFMWANAKATNEDYNEKVENGSISDGISINNTPSEVKFQWYIPLIVVIDLAAIGGCGYWIFKTFRKKKTDD